MKGQDLRSFVAAYGQAHPGEVVRVGEPVSAEHDVMAVVLEYERRRRYPVLLFERVTGHDIPIVANVVASRRALAFALGVSETSLAAEYARRIKDHVKPVVAPEAAFRHAVITAAPTSTSARCPSRSTSPATPAAISPRACWWRAIRRREWRRRAITAFRSRDGTAWA